MTLKAPEGAPAQAAWTTETARDLTGRVGGRLGSVYTAALRGFSASMSAEQAAAMRRDPRVAAVEQDSFIKGLPAQISPAKAAAAQDSLKAEDSVQTSVPWHLDRIDQPNASLSGTYDYDGDAANVSIYVIDSGVRATHREFGGRVKKAPPPFDGDDCTGLGTAAAGAAAGETFGVAKKATVYSVDGFGCEKAGKATDTLGAIEWVTKNAQRPAVANIIRGDLSEALEQAISNSIKTGITYVMAAGGVAADPCDHPVKRLREAIVVAATDRNDNATFFSNYGPCVNLYAPGFGVTTASRDGDTATTTATDSVMEVGIAAGLVAGAAALYLSKHPAATPREVEAALVACATTGAIGKPRPSSPDRLLNSRCPDGPTVTNPGRQRFAAGRPVRLDKLKARGGDGSALRYQATGLPAGLSIDGTTGVISGTPSAGKEGAANARIAKVTVTDASASTSTTFRWDLIAGYGHITTDNNTCLDNPAGGLNDGNPLQLWLCNQGWTVHADGTIQFEMLGKTEPAKCVTASDQATPDGPRVVVSTCTGAKTQVWHANEKQQLVNAATGKCLTARANYVSIPIVLADCAGAVPALTWKLPNAIPSDITVAPPGDQSTRKGTRVRLRVAADAYDTTMNLRYSATGLPRGLSMDADTGMISGTAADPGTSTVKVTATGPDGTSSSETFRWQIADGPIVGIDRMCVTNDWWGRAQTARLYGCDNTNETQLATVRPDGRLEVGRRCLTLAGEATADGSALVFAECGDSASQVWRPGAYGTLRNTASGLCLTASRSSSATELIVTACTAERNQQWRLPTEPPPGAIKHVSGSWCGELLGDPWKGRVGVWDCTNRTPQTWMVIAGDRILNEATGKCMTPVDNGTAVGTEIVGAPCSDSNRAQEWRQRPDGTILNVASGRCLYVRDLAHTEPMTLADCTADNRQLWKLPT